MSGRRAQSLPAHMLEPVKPERGRCVTAICFSWKIITCIVSHVTLVLLVVSYCVGGAYLFQHLERPHEIEVKWFHYFVGFSFFLAFFLLIICLWFLWKICTSFKMINKSLLNIYRFGQNYSIEFKNAFLFYIIYVCILVTRRKFIYSSYICKQYYLNCLSAGFGSAPSYLSKA